HSISLPTYHATAKICALSLHDALPISAPRIGVEFIDVRLEVRDEGLAVRDPLRQLAERIDLERYPGQPQVVPEPLAQQDDLAVRVRPSEAERLGAHLVELAIAALLRTLMAEHRPGVPEPLGAVVQQVVLDRCPHDARGGLRTKGKRFTIERIDEGVHLFLDDVRDFADAAHEEPGGLHDRGADTLVAVRRHGAGDGFLEPAPPMCFGRQDIVHAPHAPDFLGLAHCLVVPERVAVRRSDGFTGSLSGPRRSDAPRSPRRWPGT